MTDNMDPAGGARESETLKSQGELVLGVLGR